MLIRIGMDRKTLITKHAELVKELENLRLELATYCEQDPVEMDRKRNETQKLRDEVETYTDQILSMESWLKEQMGGDLEALSNLKRMYYGGEYDEEEGGLREL